MSGLDKSLFISDIIHERKVKMPDGSEHVFHFKESPCVEFRRFYLAERATEEDIRAGSMSKLIASSLCTPEGKEVLTFQQALRLTAAAANSIFVAILEVNGYGKDAPGKTLPPGAMTGSGMSSPSRSVGAQSPSGRA